MTTTNHNTTHDKTWTDLVNERLRTLRFGVVQLTVHEGRVVQIDYTERTRLPAGPQQKGEPPGEIHTSV